MYLVRHDAQAGTRWYPEGNCWLDNLQEKRWSHGWVPHLTLRQGLLPVRQLAMCLFASHFCRSSNLKCGLSPSIPTHKDFWEQFSQSQHQTTKLLAMSHTASFERETQLLLRVKSKLYHRQGKDTSFFADEAFQLLGCARPFFFIICHRQGRNTFFVEAVQKMGKLLKRAEDENLENFWRKSENLHISWFSLFLKTCLFCG